MSAFTLERHGAVAVLAIARPPVNALRFADWLELRALVEGLEDDEAIRAVVLTGVPGRHFSAGNDTAEFGPSTARDIDLGTAAVRDGLRAVWDLSKPCVAALHGAAVGSALLLAAACDIRLATPDARLGLPEILAGAFGGYRLARVVVPPGEARMMAYTGRPITGQRAYELGIVQELCADGPAVSERALALATEIAGLLTGSLRDQAKPLLNRLDEGAGVWDGHDLERLLEIRVRGREGA